VNALRVFVPFCLAAVALAGCEAPAYDYYSDAKPVIDANCATCHQPGQIAPFSLTDYDEVAEAAPILAPSIEANVMPPWGADATCNEYLHDTSLTDADKELLLTWIEDGAPAGDPADAVEVEPAPEVEFDLSVPLPTPYTPAAGLLDDYRCMLVDWPLDEPTFVTGFGIDPDRTELVHHAVAYVADPGLRDALGDLDDADPGSGYSCYGAPTPQNAPGIVGMGVDMRWVGQWAPGPTGRTFAEGTGIRIEPGSTLVIQMHYNTATADPSPDQSEILLQLRDDVESPATVVPFLNFGWALGSVPMTIPAGDPDAVATFEQDIANSTLDIFGGAIDIANGDSFELREIFFHMHTLGSSGTLMLQKADGSTECVLGVPRWDFSWQNSYVLAEPIRVDPGDTMKIECRFDASDESSDVGFGDGSYDEMCLAILYVTAAD